MELNLKSEIKNILTGQPVHVDNKPMTLGDVVTQALVADFKDDGEQKVTGQVKFRRYGMAKKCVGAEKANFTSEELTEIKDLIGKLYITSISGQAWELIEHGSN